MGFLSSLMGGDDAKKAAEAQAQGYRESIDTFKDYGQNALNYQQPFSDVGRVGTQNLMAMYGGDEPDYSNFFASPDYQFAYDEGMRGVENSAAARGMTMSGRQLKDLTRYGQGMGAQQFGNYFNRMAHLTGVGQNAANQRSNISLWQGGNIGSAQQGEGGARASGYMAEGNIKQGIGNALLNTGSYIAGNKFGGA